MPTNLVENTVAFPPQTAPVGGEPRTSGSIETPFQNAADRTGYLRDRLLHIDPNREGIRRVRRFANVAALQASVDMPDGTICQVTGMGIYQYVALSELAETLPIVVKPTSVGGDPGAWLLGGHGALNVANGFAQLDADGKMPLARLPAMLRLVDLYTSAMAKHATTSSSYVDVPTIQPTFSMLTGDRVIIGGQGFVYQEDLTATVHHIKWVVVKPDTSLADLAGELHHEPSAINEAVPLSIGVYYTATADGTHTFKCQHKNALGAGATLTLENVSIWAQHWRP